MKLIDKHLLREYLMPLFYCVCGFSMLYIVVDLFGKADDFLAAGEPFWRVGWYYICFLAAYMDHRSVSFLVTVLPVSLLAAALYSLSSLSRHNELTAMRASGISIFRLMYPFFGVGLICSVLGTGTQELLAPRASRWVDEFERALPGESDAKRRIIQHYKYYDETTRRRWEVDEFDPAAPAVLKGVRVRTERADTTRIADIFADTAQWRDHQWWFSGIKIQKYDENDEPLPQDGQQQFDLVQSLKMPRLTETPEDFLMTIEGGDRQGRYDTSMSVLRYINSRSVLGDARWVRRRVETHSRMAMPWACLVVTLLAIPAGTRGGRRSVLAGVLFAVTLLFLFYATVMVGGFLGQKQVLSPWFSAWLPNIVFFAAGIAMLSKVRS